MVQVAYTRNYGRYGDAPDERFIEAGRFFYQYSHYRVCLKRLRRSLVEHYEIVSAFTWRDEIRYEEEWKNYYDLGKAYHKYEEMNAYLVQMLAFFETGGETVTKEQIKELI